MSHPNERKIESRENLDFEKSNYEYGPEHDEAVFGRYRLSARDKAKGARDRTQDFKFY